MAYIAVTAEKTAQYGFMICKECWEINKTILTTIGLHFSRPIIDRKCIICKKHNSRGIATYTKRLTKECSDGRLVTE